MSDDTAPVPKNPKASSARELSGQYGSKPRWADVMDDAAITQEQQSKRIGEFLQSLEVLREESLAEGRHIAGFLREMTKECLVTHPGEKPETYRVELFGSVQCELSTHASDYDIMILRSDPDGKGNLLQHKNDRGLHYGPRIAEASCDALHLVSI